MIIPATVNVQDAAATNMKKLIFFIILFLIYTAIVCFCPVVTQWDKNIIVAVQNLFKDLPIWIPLLPDCSLYTVFIILPLIIGFILFFRRMLVIDIVLFFSAPLAAYILNSILKLIIHRPRPDISLQLGIHPHSFSYVSNHTFITCSLWGLVIYYLIKYCSNKFIKYFGITFSIIWILFVGTSRIWLGVHNPTDVIGGYLLAGILLYVYINMIKLIGGKG